MGTIEASSSSLYFSNASLVTSQLWPLWILTVQSWHIRSLHVSHNRSKFIPSCFEQVSTFLWGEIILVTSAVSLSRLMTSCEASSSHSWCISLYLLQTKPTVMAVACCLMLPTLVAVCHVDSLESVSDVKQVVDVEGSLEARDSILGRW